MTAKECDEKARECMEAPQDDAMWCIASGLGAIYWQREAERAEQREEQAEYAEYASKLCGREVTP